MVKKEIFELSIGPKWREDTKKAYNIIFNMGDKVKTITEGDAIELLDGAVDMHVHSIPDPEIDVSWDQLEIAKKATDIRYTHKINKFMTNKEVEKRGQFF